MADLSEIIEELVDKRMRDLVSTICTEFSARQIEVVVREHVAKAIKIRLPEVMKEVEKQLLNSEIKVNLFGSSGVTINLEEKERKIT